MVIRIEGAGIAWGYCDVYVDCEPMGSNKWVRNPVKWVITIAILAMPPLLATHEL